jgi:hypothetical protein
MREQGLRVVEASSEMAMLPAAQVAAGAAEVAQGVGQVVRQDAPQPGAQLLWCAALEGRSVPVGFQQGLLHEVGGVELGL